MSRLFITHRELAFISDIAKETLKDIVGSYVLYYPINELKTLAHAVYNEAIQKVFDNPIKMDCLVNPQVPTDTKIDKFGADAKWMLEIYVQWRDLVEKGINPNIGDFISFGDVFYEITERVFDGYIYGLPEHKRGMKLIATKARDGQFKALIVGPTDISHPDPDAVQETFHQQRGLPTNKDGETGDVRDLVRDGVLDAPLDGQREVSPAGAIDVGKGSSFYEDED